MSNLALATLELGPAKYTHGSGVVGSKSGGSIESVTSNYAVEFTLTNTMAAYP